MEDASALKRWLYRSFMAVAKRVGTKILERQRVGLLERILYHLGDFLIYAPLRNVLGMSKVRIAYTGGEAIGPDLFSFYRSLGINLKQLYGSTETSVFVCVQPDGQVKSDTVGPAVKGVELKFTPQRELLIRSPGLFKEYYKNPQATREAKDAEGWFHTGDAGYVDQDGHVRIIDRAKDVGKLADGELTRTRKVRRGFIAEKYGSLVEAMFQGRNSVHVEAQVKYEDGRSATFAAELKIRDAKTFVPAAARRAA